MQVSKTRSPGAARLRRLAIGAGVGLGRPIAGQGPIAAEWLADRARERIRARVAAGMVYRPVGHPDRKRLGPGDACVVDPLADDDWLANLLGDLGFGRTTLEPVGSEQSVAKTRADATQLSIWGRRLAAFSAEICILGGATDADLAERLQADIGLDAIEALLGRELDEHEKAVFIDGWWSELDAPDGVPLTT